ncbi:Cytochrome b5 heme-binding domain-containing protein [Aphelenchoides fujianensis]|nr:Cytochrome b5 heme-binding domain-containing protein [Aphelenchoides fujianensis]
MQEFTRAEVALHNTRSSAWIIVRNKVYDISDFFDEHPGGDIVLLDRIGDDATIEFYGQEHSADAKEMLKDRLIGRLKDEEKGKRMINVVEGCRLLYAE